MTLYRLGPADSAWHGHELLADSDEEARATAADKHSEELHRSPNSVLFRWEHGTWTPIADTSPILPAHPSAPPPEPRPSPGEPRPLPDISLYEDDDDRHRFGELSECLHQVELALRQLGRAQTAHRAEQSKRLELGFLEGRPPDELVALGQDRTDAMEFAIIAANRALVARRYLTKERGLDLPEVREAAKVWALRDLYEHWVKWKVVERESFLDDHRWLLTKPAGTRWNAAAPGTAPGRGFGATAAPPPGPWADPNGRITSWSSIDLDHLTEDLTALHDALAVHETEAFQWEMPDEAASRELLGPTVWSLLHVFTNVRGHVARDGVVRWRRSWLLAADQAIREQHWVIDHQVLGPREPSGPAGS